MRSEAHTPTPLLVPLPISRRPATHFGRHSTVSMGGGERSPSDDTSTRLPPQRMLVLSSASASAIGSVWEAARRTERRGAQARGGRGQVTCAAPRGRLLLVRAPPRVVAHGRAELAQEPHEHLRTRADVTLRAHSLGFHFLIYTGVLNSKVTLSTFPLSRLNRER